MPTYYRSWKIGWGTRYVEDAGSLGAVDLWGVGVLGVWVGVGYMVVFIAIYWYFGNLGTGGKGASPCARAGGLLQTGYYPLALGLSATPSKSPAKWYLGGLRKTLWDRGQSLWRTP